MAVCGRSPGGPVSALRATSTALLPARGGGSAHAWQRRCAQLVYHAPGACAPTAGNATAPAASAEPQYSLTGAHVRLVAEQPSAAPAQLGHTHPPPPSAVHDSDLSLMVRPHQNAEALYAPLASAYEPGAHAR